MTRGGGESGWRSAGRFARRVPAYAASAAVAGWLVLAGALPGVADDAARPEPLLSADARRVATRDAAAAEPATASASDGSASASNAGNYGRNTQLAVNERTAELTLDAALVSLPGITEDVTLTITLSYSSADATSDLDADVTNFGLPYGWKYNISYIDNRDTYSVVELDGAQSYTIDSTFRTGFTPTGSSTSVSAYTGLLQYNRADLNFRADAGSVTVGGLPSAFVLQNLDGTARYFSSGGLLLETLDRFGNTLQYFYTTTAGAAADSGTTPPDARIARIVDSWGNPTAFTYCDVASSGCTAGEVTITLPDGRTTSFVIADQYRVSQITSPSGLVTVLGWIDSPCAHGEQLIASMTSAVGGFSAVTWTCMNVCTAPSASSCLAAGDATTWPVVAGMTECPNNASGSPCPDGETDGAYLSTRYTLGTSSNASNYTGFPLYSPYAPSDPLADALMASNDAAFVYTTTVTHLHTDSSTAFEIASDFNFLHLKTDTTVSVWAQQADGSYGLSPTRTTSYCYATTAASPASGCPTDTTTNYQALPANYQSPVIMGSCVFPVDDVGESGTVRLSVATRAYDSFGNAINARLYYGTAATAVLTTCDRALRLDPGPLQLVSDDYRSFDTPTSLDGDGYVALGPGAGHYGLRTGRELFSYLEPQADATSIYGAIADTSGPILVQLTCGTLTDAATAIAVSTTGLLPADTAAPGTAGTTACGTPAWDTSVAAPKQTAYTYDGIGRVLTRTTSWADGASPPDGSIASTSDTLAYTLATTEAGEESCGDAADVLQTTLTDGQGNVTTTRVCTLNGFPLSIVDAAGNTRTMTHDAEGLTTQVTYPNGAAVTYDYYYQCPIAADGVTPTCPAESTASDCPYDDQTPARSCVVQTLEAGSSGATYADGVLQVSIKDGLGRVVARRDNLGGQSGAGYTALQTRATTTWDDLGRESSRTEQIGAGDPLVYTTTTAYDAKSRPSLLCGPRGNARQYGYDDIQQQVLSLRNGIQKRQTSYNDARQATAVLDCPVMAGTATSAAGDCPTAASSVASVSCSGTGYASYTLHDGGGVPHSLVAAGAETGASVSAVQGTATWSADLLRYAYTATATAASGSPQAAVTASSAWTRDLQGLPLVLDVSVTDGGGTTSTFASDTYSYNDIGETLGERNKLSDVGDVTLQETYDYTPNRLISTRVNAAGVTFQSSYDAMDRLERYCYPSGSGSEGETLTYDGLTGSLLSITHFTNPSGCMSCSGDACGDVATDAITYTYARFGKPLTKTYADGTALQWGYDAYQRPSCFADAVATAAGSSCPPSPTDADFAPVADQLLTWITYWPDSDAYRRGLPMSICRGVADGAGGFLTKCLDYDYYTPVDVGGACDASLAGVVGAFAGFAKSETLCTGGSCLSGTGTLEYQTTWLYDAHGRACSVQSLNGAGALILGTTYAYDQFDNLVAETSASDLDASTTSNFQMTYAYDGLMRVISSGRAAADGSFLESNSYTYDAASNLIQKVRVAALTATPAPTATATAGVPTPTATAPTLACVGDCDGGGAVTINELITLVNLALGGSTATCAHGVSGGEPIDIADLMTAVHNALEGC